MFKRIYRMLVNLIFNSVVEPQKEELKHKLADDSNRATSRFVKLRNDIEGRLLEELTQEQVEDI